MNIWPFIVEFTGTPEAGKTTTIKRVKSLLELSPHVKQGGICYIRESAEVAPNCIPKGSFDANLWMRAHLVVEFLEQVYNPINNSIIIVDRGLIDSQFFNYLFYSRGLCSSDEFKLSNSLLDTKALLPNLLIHLTITPEESIRRRGGEGRIVTLNWVKIYNNLFEQFISSVSVPIFSMDTTNVSPDIVVETITSKISTIFSYAYCYLISIYFVFFIIEQNRY